MQTALLGSFCIYYCFFSYILVGSVELSLQFYIDVPEDFVSMPKEFAV